LKSLAEEMQAVSKGLEKVEQELAASENDGPISTGFRKVRVKAKFSILIKLIMLYFRYMCQLVSNSELPLLDILLFSM